MNRFALLALLFFSTTAFAADDPPKNWKDQLVVGKKYPKDIRFGDVVDGKQVSFEFRGFYPIKVREDRDGWLRIFDGHREGWADKDDFILSLDAPAYFTTRIQQNAKDSFAYSMRGMAWDDRGEYDLAIKDFNEWISLDPSDSSAFNSRGTSWHNKKEYDKAIKDYDEAIRLNPKSSIAFHNRGLAWDYKKEYDKAIKDYDEAIRLDPKYAIAFHNRGNAWRDKKEYDKAIKDYDEAIRLDPKFALAFNIRGNAWLDKKEYDKAIKDYDEAIRLDPKCANAFLNRGNAWYNKKEYDKAIKDYDEAIRLDPKYVLAFHNRGSAWDYKKEYDKAIKDYDEAIRLDPKYSYAFLSRSIALMLSRKPVIDGFQKVIEIQGLKGDRSTYAVILGNLSARLEMKDSIAKEFLDKAKELSDDWPRPVVKYLQGEIDQESLLKLAIDDDKRTEAHCYLGLDLLIKGKNNEALKHFKWVKEHGTPSFIEYTIAIAELDRLEKK